MLLPRYSVCLCMFDRAGARRAGVMGQLPRPMTGDYLCLAMPSSAPIVQEMLRDFGLRN
jgi:hypothetical protein